MCRLVPCGDTVSITENHRANALPSVSIRFAVKEATRTAHERLDHGLGRLDLTHGGGYRLFLKTIAAAHLPLEALLERSGVERILSDWPERTRAEALRRDLEALGESAVTENLDIELVDEPVAFGVLYTLEGSRLGGRYLLETVKRARANPPADFLQHGDSRLWGSFCAQLEASPAAHENLDDVIAGAQYAFTVFERAMRESLFSDGAA